MHVNNSDFLFKLPIQFTKPLGLSFRLFGPKSVDELAAQNASTLVLACNKIMGFEYGAFVNAMGSGFKRSKTPAALAAAAVHLKQQKSAIANRWAFARATIDNGASRQEEPKHDVPNDGVSLYNNVSAHRLRSNEDRKVRERRRAEKGGETGSRWRRKRGRSRTRSLLQRGFSGQDLFEREQQSQSCTRPSSYCES